MRAREIERFIANLQLKGVKISLKLNGLDIGVEAPGDVSIHSEIEILKREKEHIVSYLKTISSRTNSDLIDFPLSSTQYSFWLDMMKDSTGVKYNMPEKFRITGELNIDKLRRACLRTIERHESLRTTLVFDSDNNIKQKPNLLSEDKLSFDYEDFSKLSLKEAESRIHSRLYSKFDLFQEYPFRIGLYLIEKNVYIFTILTHHLFSDAFSLKILMETLLRDYEKLKKSESNEDSKPLATYKEFVLAEKNTKKRKEFLEEAFSYWKSELGEVTSKINFPGVQLSKGRLKKTESYNIEINQELYSKIDEFCKKNNLTKFIFLLVVWSILIKRYTQQTDFLLNYPVSGRKGIFSTSVTGLFARVLPLKISLDESLSVLSFFQIIRDKISKGLKFQLFPLFEYNSLRKQAFQSKEVLINYEKSSDKKLAGNGYILENLSDELPQNNKAGLDINLQDSGKDLRITLSVDTDQFQNHVFDNILRNFEFLSNEILEKNQCKIAELDILSKQEREAILMASTGDHIDLDFFASNIVERFKKCANLYPETRAIIFENQKLSYLDLEIRSNQFANFLQSNFDTGCSTKVAITVDRNIHTGILLLGILKTNSCFVPIDSNSPEIRKKNLVSQCDLVVDDQILNKFINYYKTTRVSDFEYKMSSPESICYCLFTSGTTGNPKGVEVTHANVSNLLDWYINKYQTGKDFNTIQLTDFTFDPFIEEFFGSICSGGTFFSVSKELLLNKNRLAEFIEDNEINLLNNIPNFLSDLLIPRKRIPSIKYIISGGERLHENQKNSFLNKGYTLYNNYGPTETTVDALSGKMNVTDPVDIGYPIQNTQILILDSNKKLLPSGCVGSMYVGGTGVSNGYLDNSELSNQYFFRNSFGNGMLYYTGDLAQRLPGGRIKYLGREDSQIKIRGQRIELKEIEDIALNFDQQIAEVLVVEVNEIDSGGRLGLYIVSDNEDFNLIELKSFLTRRLPYIMVPTYFKRLDHFPKLSNGKMNTGLFPKLEQSDLIKKEYRAPVTSNQRNMVSIWEKELGIKDIGITDNFFELGGHSLLISKIINQCKEKIGISPEFSDFFASPTIEKLCLNLKLDSYAPIQKVSSDTKTLASPSQRGIYIDQQLRPNTSLYNISSTLEITGNLDVENFLESFISVINKFEIMQTVFEENNTYEIIQKVVSGANTNEYISYTDMTGETENNFINIIKSAENHAFDLSSLPLFKAFLIKISDNKFIFHLTIHHIISDGWSFNLLISHLIEKYYGKDLPEQSIQFRDYSHWINSESEKRIYREATDYFRELMGRNFRPIEISSKSRIVPSQEFRGKMATVRFEKELLSKLTIFAEQHDLTLFMLLSSIVKFLLYKYSGNSRFFTGTLYAGRENPELESQLGNFINRIPIPTEIDSRDSITEFLNKQKQAIIRAFEYRNYPFEFLIEDLKLSQTESRSPLFDIMIILHTQQELAEFENIRSYHDFQIQELKRQKNNSKYDISFLFEQVSDGLELNLEYNDLLYSSTFIESIFSHFQNVARYFLESAQSSLNSVPYCNLNYLDTLENSDQDFKSVKRIFERVVEKFPDQIALSCNDGNFDYRKLNEKSNSLGAYLREIHHISKSDKVCVNLPKGFDLITSVIGLIKLGAVYIPLDIDLPEERKSFIKKDISSKLTIDSSLITDYKESTFFQQKLANPNLQVSEDDLSYIIYTSGSTGQPKGVAVSQYNFQYFLRTVQNEFFNDIHRMPVIASPSFDISLFQIFSPLTSGGVLEIIDKKSFEDIRTFLSKIMKCSIIDTVPAIYEMIIKEIERRELHQSFDQIEQVFVGGDSVSDLLLIKLNRTFRNAIITVTYGPTESTIFCSSISYGSEVFKESLSLPVGANIGSPLAGTVVFVMDSDGQFVSEEVLGEICITGPGVSAGYINQKALTNDKYRLLKNGIRYYKTGDLGKTMPDGTILFSGRSDNQIKVNGVRIETEEIELQIQKRITDVEKAKVILYRDESGFSQLRAFYTGKENIPEDMKQKIKDVLPDNMIPNQFIHLKDFPVTRNNKLDRKALENFHYSLPKTIQEEEFSETEKYVIKEIECILTKSILEIDIHSNFFDLGLNSLAIIQLANSLREGLSLELQAVQLFKYSNVQKLAKFIDSQKSENRSGDENNVDVSDYMEDTMDLFDD